MSLTADPTRIPYNLYSPDKHCLKHNNTAGDINERPNQLNCHNYPQHTAGQHRRW
jgi:hypothetical protein